MSIVCLMKTLMTIDCIGDSNDLYVFIKDSYDFNEDYFYYSEYSHLSNEDPMTIMSLIAKKKFCCPPMKTVLTQ